MNTLTKVAGHAYEEGTDMHMRRAQTIPNVAALFAGLRDLCRFVNNIP
jgi:hypothetical protein